MLLMESDLGKHLSPKITPIYRKGNCFSIVNHGCGGRTGMQQVARGWRWSIKLFLRFHEHHTFNAYLDSNSFMCWARVIKLFPKHLCHFCPIWIGQISNFPGLHIHVRVQITAPFILYKRTDRNNLRLQQCRANVPVLGRSSSYVTTTQGGVLMWHSHLCNLHRNLLSHANWI